MIFEPPEVAFTVKGVNIYHTYKNGDIELPMSFWYSFSQDESAEEFEFDIRDYGNVVTRRRDEHMRIIERAMESGAITNNDLPDGEILES